MNTTYILIGLLCGLAIGYAFGWQERRRKHLIIEAEARRAVLLDVHIAIRQNRCDGESPFADGVQAANRNMLQHIDYLLAQSVDCEGGSPCTTCPDRKQCSRAGCLRQSEFIGKESTK